MTRGDRRDTIFPLAKSPLQIVSGVAGTGKTSLAYVHIAASLFGAPGSPSTEVDEIQNSSPAKLEPIGERRRSSRLLHKESGGTTFATPSKPPVLPPSEDSADPLSALALALENSAQKHTLFLARSPRLTQSIAKSVASELSLLDNIGGVEGGENSFGRKFAAMSWERFLLRAEGKAIVAECPGLMGDVSLDFVFSFKDEKSAQKTGQMVAQQVVEALVLSREKSSSPSLNQLRRTFDSILDVLKDQRARGKDGDGIASRVLEAFDRWCLERAEAYLAVSGKTTAGAGVLWEEVKRLANGGSRDQPNAHDIFVARARAYILALMDAFTKSSLEFAQLYHRAVEEKNVQALTKTGFFVVLENAGKWVGREYRRQLEESGNADPWAAPYAGWGAFLQYNAGPHMSSSETYLLLQHVAASVDAGLLSEQKKTGIPRSFFGVFISVEKVLELEVELERYRNYLKLQKLTDPTLSSISTTDRVTHPWTSIVVDEAQLFAPLEYLRIIQAAGFSSRAGTKKALLSFFLDENQQFADQSPSGKVAELLRLGQVAGNHSSNSTPRLVSLASNLRSHPPICAAATAVLGLRNRCSLDFSHAAAEVVSGLADAMAPPGRAG